MKSGLAFQNYWIMALQILFGIFIRNRKGFIPGGPTDLRPGRKMQDGGSTTFLPLLH